MIVVGIDPGLTGAIAFLADGGDLLGVRDMPVVDKAVNAPLLIHLIQDIAPDMAVVESVHAMPKQGVTSTFKLGRAFGVVEGVIGSLGIPVTLVRPAQWKRAMGLTSDKERSRRLAIERWPHRADLFARRKDDGRAEAALIALWRYQQETSRR